ncbi:hypothetical protein BGZ82_010160 [Podila clonocystis]|nr:hypothetical protein BGZ82_010160 [Podila clonocystis]
MASAPPSPLPASALVSQHALSTSSPVSTTLSRAASNTTAATTSSESTRTAAIGTPAAAGAPFSDRILAAEHRFTSLTQNIAHFSPLKVQLDKHNLAIERLESEVKKKTALLQSCQGKLQVKALAKRPQSSRQGSHISLHGSDDGETELLLVQQQSAKETLESLNGQLLAAKILHIGLTRQVTQYFESRSNLNSLLEEHPSEDALERELAQISADIIKVKDDFEKHRAAKNEFKEVRRFVDIWNDAVEKQVASNPTKSFKKFVPFFGPKPPSYTKIADLHMTNARAFVPSLQDIGNLSDIKMDTIADTSSELVIFTAKFKDAYNSLSHTLEVLHKKSRVLKKKKNTCLGRLFDERCKIFSHELQAHYRNVGASLANGSQERDESRLPIHRQHVEGNADYSSEGSTLGHGSLGHGSQEFLLEPEELPSYFQHEQEAASHRRTGSMGSPARSSSASSSLSLHSPHPGYVESPPDYVRNEPGPSLSVAAGSSVDDEDALFRAYHQRYDTSRRRQDSDPRSRVAMAQDTPPGYDETYAVVDPV